MGLLPGVRSWDRVALPVSLPQAPGLFREACLLVLPEVFWSVRGGSRQMLGDLLAGLGKNQPDRSADGSPSSPSLPSLFIPFVRSMREQRWGRRITGH